MATWYARLPGDPAWWQAFAGIAQVVLAAALFWITRKYVALTADLVRLQADVVKLQKQSEQRDLYERRVKVFDCTMGFLAAFARDVKIELEPIMQLYRDTREAEFLFGPDVPAFIEKVGKTAHEHRSLRPDTAYATGDQKRIDRITGVEGWLSGPAFEQAKEVFGRYLRLADPETPTEDARGPS